MDISQAIPQIDFATLDLLPYGVIIVNRAGTILYYNAREEQIAGRRRADVVGKNFFTEVAPCTQVQEFYGRFQETTESVGDVANFHFRFPFPERPREVEISLTSFEHQGEVLCMISVSDVTEQEALREHLLQAERLREVGEVAAGVAHNFNNLLTAIKGNAQLLLRTVTDEKARQKLERILQASDDGVEMVKRIRESTRQQPDAAAIRTTAQLNDIVRDSLDFTEEYIKRAQAERGINISVESELADDLLPVLAHAGALREVFVNLLRNAVDAIEGHGSIAVRSRAEPNFSVVEVSDTGAGMDGGVLEKLFRPLFTTKGERGTGLGLATCYAIVRRHGGDITVRSAKGNGSTFTVRLPVAAES